MKKSEGSIGEFMSTGICILALTFVMISYFNCSGLIQQKISVGQLSRKYILRMEVCGYLLPEDESMLVSELKELGVTDIDCSGTTVSEVGFGNILELNIRGKLKGEYDFEEHRTSTAKY